MKEFFIGIIFLGLIVIVFFGLIKFSEYNSVEPIRNLSYKSNEELKPYIDKFFRDLDNNNISYTIPQNFTVKFSDLESNILEITVDFSIDNKNFGVLIPWFLNLLDFPAQVIKTFINNKFY